MRQLLTFLLLSLLGLLALAATAQGNAMRVVYKQFDFYIPEDPVLVAYLGTNSEILAVKYSEQQGKKYVSFGREHGLTKNGCPLATFFEEVLRKSIEDCHEGAVKSFQAVFANDADSGSWSGASHKFFYFISKNQSTVFVLPEEPGDTLYKVESDYLDKAGVKAIFSKYL